MKYKTLEMYKIRIVADMKIKKLNSRELEYILEGINNKEYNKIIVECEKMAEKDFCEIFQTIKGYNDLSDTNKEVFNGNIISFSRSQGKGKLMNVILTYIEKRPC